MMLFCKFCMKLVRGEDHDGKTWCTYCATLLAHDCFSEEAAFVKTSDGQSRMAGNLKSIRQETSESRERTINEAYDEIRDMMVAIGIDGGEGRANEALGFYKFALAKNFTRGRRKELVLAACLYIILRLNKKPYLLIDFSEHLRINVYVLGAVFLQLCKVLSLQENPTILNLLDPSLFIHRFADRLFKDRRAKTSVSKTALLIVASMKRDWMQTGRKPSGLCGAALYISALAHGVQCSKSEIIKAVYVCEATLTKRLIEFENTESGGLTIEEFEKKSKEFDDQAEMFGKDKSVNAAGEKASRSGELLCKHKGSGTPQFAYGLCNECYKDFMILSGGLNGGSEPPAFQRAQRKRTMAEEAASDVSQNLNSSTFPGLTQCNSKLLNYDEQRSMKNTIENDGIEPAHPDSIGATFPLNITHDNERMDASDFTLEESESLSDIDDPEVDACILNEKERNYKTTVWEEINREYLQEQAEKEAAKKAYEDMFSNCSEDVGGARKLAAAAAAAVAQNRKEKRQKRAAEFKNLGPPQTAAEAVKQMIQRKGMSSRFRQDKMEEMFGSESGVKSEQDDQSAEKSPTEPVPKHDDDDGDDDDDEQDTQFDGNGEEAYAEEYNLDEDYTDMDDY